MRSVKEGAEALQKASVAGTLKHKYPPLLKRMSQTAGQAMGLVSGLCWGKRRVFSASGRVLGRFRDRPSVELEGSTLHQKSPRGPRFLL